MATERVLDIFNVLKNIDTKNRGFYDGLSEEQKKAFVPFVIMQWMCCGKDDYQITMINTFVNNVVFNLNKHPGLLFRLLVCCSSGIPQYYKWASSVKNKNKYPLSIKLLQKHTGCSTRRAIVDLELISSDDLLMLACDYGYQKEELKAIQKELKLRI